MTAKKKSGARRRTADIAEARRLVERHGFVVVKAGQAPSKLSPTARAAIESVGAPPEDHEAALIWGRRLLTTTTWLAALGELDLAVARSLKDGVFALGSTHSRAEVDRRLLDVEEACGLLKQQQYAVALQDTRGLPRNANSRGGSRSRRPQPVVAAPPDDDHNTPRGAA